MSLENSRGNSREFCSVLHLIYIYYIISSFDKCSYSARHNVEVHYNFVDSIETLKKKLSVDFSAHKIRFRRVYQRFSFHQSCFAGAQTDDFAQNSTEHFIFCSILELQTCIVYPVWQARRTTNTACLVCIECARFLY